MIILFYLYNFIFNFLNIFIIKIIYNIISNFILIYLIYILNFFIIFNKSKHYKYWLQMYLIYSYHIELWHI